MQNTMRFSELHCREVINLCDGARMGEVSDLLFDPVSADRLPHSLCPRKAALSGCSPKMTALFRGGALKPLGRTIFW